MKRIFVVPVIAISLMLSACQADVQDKENMTLTSPDANSYEETIPNIHDTITTQEAYAVVVGEYYTAMEEEWDASELMDAGLNYMIAECYQNNPLENIGYAIIDIDGDGIEELLIGVMVEDEFYSNMIFELYTLDDKGVHRLVFDSSERNRYYYAGENRFANLGSGAFNESFETTVKFEDGEIIDMTYTTDPSDYVLMDFKPFSEWVK